MPPESRELPRCSPVRSRHRLSAGGRWPDWHPPDPWPPLGNEVMLSGSRSRQVDPSRPRRGDRRHADRGPKAAEYGGFGKNTSRDEADRAVVPGFDAILSRKAASQAAVLRLAEGCEAD